MKSWCREYGIRLASGCSETEWYPHAGSSRHSDQKITVTCNASMASIRRIVPRASRVRHTTMKARSFLDSSAHMDARSISNHSMDWQTPAGTAYWLQRPMEPTEAASARMPGSKYNIAHLIPSNHCGRSTTACGGGRFGQCRTRLVEVEHHHAAVTCSTTGCSIWAAQCPRRTCDTERLKLLQLIFTSMSETASSLIASGRGRPNFRFEGLRYVL